MKKVITILAVLIVLASAVFAAETHTIKVKADVTEVVPVFGLTMTSPDHDDYVTNAATPVSQGSSEYTTQYGKGDAYGHTQNSQAFDVEFNLNEDGSVTFQALLLNRAKQNETYTLEFGGGSFAVTKAGGAGTHAPASITTSAGTTLTGLTIGLGSAAAVGGETNKKINLTFDGKTVNIGNTGKYVLGTAIYAYEGDDDIDPSKTSSKAVEIDGKKFYVADVTLVVSAT
ncbi:MAG: hypothetical protein IJS84_06800 [Spirochaetales bacterium]|nr:hypothetical protein [Spirochaetales bacterium]